jgi:predicted TIM-barrel fold metal-dependent hydrolase
MNPAQNSYPIDSKEVFHLVEKIISLGAVPAFHFGGDTEFTPPEGLAKIAATFPQSKIIGVHMGGGGSHFVYGDSTYIGAREIGLKHPNLFYTLSAIRDTHIHSNLLAYLKKGGQWLDNLNYGSDAPYGRLSWNFNGFKSLMGEVAEIIAFPDEVKAKFSGNNLLRLYIDALQNIMKRNF